MIVEYRVNLDNFAGPLDLLLHLVKKEELDIHDIPISRVLAQYLQYLTVITQLDLDDAGDFLVMASTLMVIKSKMLLPTEQLNLDQEIDPRFELVHQLLEYKRIKDRSNTLEQRAGVFGHMFGRPDSARVDGPLEKDRSIEEVTIFDLLQAFSKIMEATGGGQPKVRTIKIEDTPVRVFAQRLADRLRTDGSVLFGDLMRADVPRPEKIGWFLALLLLLKQQSVDCAQDGHAGDIRILWRADAPSVGELIDEFRN